MMEISFAPLLPLWSLFSLAGIVCVLTILSIRKKQRGAILRLLGAVLVLLALIGPQITRTDTRQEKDIAFILNDTSTSQSLGDRRAQGQQALEKLKIDASAYQDLEIRTIDLAPQPDEDKSGTRIINRIKQALGAIDPERYAGSVLLTDGQIHDLKDASNLPGPLHVLITGSKKDEDRRIEIVDAPRYAIVGKPVLLRVRVLDNAQPNAKAPLFLLHENGKKQRFTPTEDGVQETVYIADHAGRQVLLLETPALENELSLNNNKVALSINGVRDRLRVLLVSGQPHQGQRTWRNILRSDPAVDLVHFTILRPSEKEDFTPLNELSLIAFPVRELFEEKLNDFDLIIFDRYYRHNVLNESYFQNIVHYVEKGGALLISAGPDFAGARSLAQTGLKIVLPALPTGQVKDDAPYRLQKTELGKRHPITTQLNSPQKDWGRWMRIVNSQTISGQTILQSENQQPLLIVDRIQQGRVAMLLSDHLWLWARGFDGGGPHNALVRNLVHWLMKEPELEENTLRLHQQDEQTIKIIRHSLTPENPPVQITFPDGTQQNVTLKAQGKGIFTQQMNAPQMGIYHGEDTTHRTTLIKGSLNPKELEDPRATKALIAPLAEKLDGSLHWLEDGMPMVQRVSVKSETVGRNWIGLPKRHKENVLGIKRSNLVPLWLILIGAAVCWCLAWWRESR
ncbi:membrane protein [Terasakiella brassicae]|uniref:Membrane protein n=1 Tax=Terasakiella brassicae TaxID=1634917 RepID=A0A917C0L7_9PROT|nr:hypothetical protein [Terasakiella brassicae]GGF66538.1 membrane protein [Terasakiella brassicae]